MKENRYLQAINSLVDIINKKAEIEELIDEVKNSLTVNEFHRCPYRPASYSEEELAMLIKAVEDSPYCVKADDYCGTCFHITDKKKITLHTDHRNGVTFPKVLLQKLIAAAEIK